MLCKLGALYKNVEITLYINLKVNKKKKRFTAIHYPQGFSIPGEYLNNEINLKLQKQVEI